MSLLQKARIAACETQPVVAAGIRTLVRECDNLEFVDAVGDLSEGARLLATHRADVLLIDKGFGVQPILETLARLRDLGAGGASVVWGSSLSEAEALRFVQSGARGILRKTAPAASLLACLRTVASGMSWMQDAVFRDAVRKSCDSRYELTSREQQVLALVKDGYKNRDIATELGIRPGTVKIHLKHIFEKTGVRGRYGLALSGLRERGLLGSDAAEVMEGMQATA